MPEESVAYSIGYMGAPEISIERIDDVTILKHSMQLCNELLLLGFEGDMSTDGVLSVAKSYGITCEEMDEKTLVS